MQRQREPDRLVDLVHEAPQARKPADGRDRRAPVRDPEVGQSARRVEHVVEVQHRLAHSHEDAVVDGLEAAEVERLVDDLPGGQVAAELHRPGRAERARQRAPGLRRDADRATTVAIAHQHGLDRMSVVRVEERLDRPVARLVLPHHGQRREWHRRLELAAQRCREVGHLLVPLRSARDPRPDLSGAERRLSAPFQLGFQQGEVHRPTVASVGS